MEARVHDDAICLLGEGALWHPERQELLWFDILGRRLHARGSDGGRAWTLPDISAAAGWIDRDTLLVSQRGALVRFDLATGTSETVTPLEADNPVTRPNDGRADPWGGFWASTIGLRGEHGAGGIWRYHRGEVRKLFARITTPNSICFHPDRSYALWSDTEEATVWRQPLDAEGWPSGEPTVFLDLKAEGLHPDGAVMDAEGNAWIALWGAGAVRGFDPDGRQVGEARVPGQQSSCPAFGGEDLSTLFVTTAAAGLPQSEHALHPDQGRTFAVDLGVRGLPEPRVAL